MEKKSQKTQAPFVKKREDIYFLLLEHFGILQAYECTEDEAWV